MDCIFCKIIRGEISSHKIYEDEYSYAFLDICNDVVGHTLVIPKVHYKDIFDCNSKVLEKLFKTVQTISKHYVENCGYDGINIMNANHMSAGQSVFHLHVHIFPRKKDDGFELWPHLPKHQSNLDEIAQKLRIN